MLQKSQNARRLISRQRTKQGTIANQKRLLTPSTEIACEFAVPAATAWSPASLFNRSTYRGQENLIHPTKGLLQQSLWPSVRVRRRRHARRKDRFHVLSRIGLTCGYRKRANFSNAFTPRAAAIPCLQSSAATSLQETRQRRCWQFLLLQRRLGSRRHPGAERSLAC